METSIVTTDTNILKTEEQQRLRELSIREIDDYGADIQELMTSSSNNILDRAKMVELGSLSDELNELNDIAKKNKKLLPVFQKPINIIRRQSDKFTRVQDRIEQISNSLEEQKNKIDIHVEYMYEQAENLKSVVDRLRECEENLSLYADEIQGSGDKVRLQAVAGRLRVIESTRVIAERAQAEALMIICEQREARMQLDEVIRNALPAIRIQAVNSIGIRVNKETQEIIKKTREVTGTILVENATEVKNMAVELQKNRSKSIVDDDKLLKAQQILGEALETVARASEVEAETNIRLSKDIADKAKKNKESIEDLIKRVEQG